MALEEVTWDLSHLLDVEEAAGDDEATVAALLDRADERAAKFAERHEGKVAELDGEGLRGAMEELAAISELAGRAANFAHLRFAADTEDPANGALVQLVSERATAIQTKLLFFELEWVEVDDERAEELLATEGLEFAAHYLRMERRYEPHLLSKPEETISTELSVTGARRLDPPVRRAHLGDPGRAARRRGAGLARRRAVGPLQPRSGRSGGRPPRP